VHVISNVKASLNWFPGYVCVFVFWQDYVPLITILFCAIWVAYMWSSTVLFSLWSLQTGWVHSNVSVYDKVDNYIMRVSFFSLHFGKRTSMGKYINKRNYRNIHSEVTKRSSTCGTHTHQRALNGPDKNK
jgi:hypothetical protein